MAGILLKIFVDSPIRKLGVKTQDENLIWTYMKTCTKCGVAKEETEFHKKRGKPMPQCKACRAIYMKQHYLDNHERERKLRKAWYEKNKSRVCEKLRLERLADPETVRLNQRLRKYGITKEQYFDKLREQNDVCAICNRPFTETPAIDHDHVTNEFRGLLHDTCNTGFGLLKEDVAIFENCIAYAKKYKK